MATNPREYTRDYRERRKAAGKGRKQITLEMPEDCQVKYMSNAEEPVDYSRLFEDLEAVRAEIEAAEQAREDAAFLRGKYKKYDKRGNPVPVRVKFSLNSLILETLRQFLLNRKADKDGSAFRLPLSWSQLDKISRATEAAGAWDSREWAIKILMEAAERELAGNPDE